MGRIGIVVGLALLLTSWGRGGAQDAVVAATPTASGASAKAPSSGVRRRLPKGPAGDVVAYAIQSAGGYDRWLAHRDVSFISTTTILDPRGQAVSETIFLHKLPLHHGLRARMESIGLPEELVFGFDGRDSWLLRDGEALTRDSDTAFTTFHGVSLLYWFSVPFVFAEQPVPLAYEGETTMGWRLWDRVRADYHDVPSAPFDWLVIYVDRESGRIDQVFCRVRAVFLEHKLWVGKWRDYRDYNGLRRERRRTFFPADETGEAIGTTAAEQIIEHVRFDSNFDPTLFERPLKANGGRPAG